jgi:two-component system sensor histidine kinase AgrC
MRFDILLINILSAFLGSLFIIYFLRTVSELRISKVGKIIFSFVFALLNGLVSSLIQESIYKPVILVILSIVIICVFLKAAVIQSFLSFSLYVIGLAIGNAIIPLILSILAPDLTVEKVVADPLVYLAGNLFTNSLVFLLFILIKPVKEYIKMTSRDKFLLILTVATVFVLCSTSVMYLYTRTLDTLGCLIIASVSISYCIFIIIVWFVSLRRVIRDEDLKHQKFYNESLRSTLFELRRFKHDWINNLTVIDSMLKLNKLAELKQYVSELIGQSGPLTDTQIYDIKNAGVFGILSSKINLAYEKGITVYLSVAGVIENIPGIKISDLCEIIGIFLDNAIEEATVADKEINVDIRDGNGSIEISVSNTCSTPPDMQKLALDGYTTRGTGRGMGLAIAKSIISRYKNILHITTYEDNMFTQTIEIANTGRKGA